MLGKLHISLWAFMCTMLSVQAVKLPALPSWSAEDKVKMSEGDLVVGVALLTVDGLKRADEKPAVKSVEVIIEAVDEKPRVDGLELLSSTSEISGEYLIRYFGKKPDVSLIDPQQVLSMQERMDMKYALQTHIDDSDVPMYVYLFDTDQRVPESYSPQNVYNKVFNESEEPVVLVYYYIGAPERSEFLLAGGASSKVPQWQVRELLWNAAHKAREKSDRFDQLDGFVAQLSMRLFWIEEILRDLVVAGPVVAVTDVAVKVDPRAEKIASLIDGPVKSHFQRILPWCLSGVLLIALIALYLFRRTLYFPENPTSSRLGGRVGAMSGGVLSYRNRRQPPSEQRSQFEKDFF